MEKKRLMIEFFTRADLKRKSFVTPFKGDRSSDSTAALLCTSSWRAIASGWWQTRRSNSIRREKQSAGIRVFSGDLERPRRPRYPFPFHAHTHSSLPLSVTRTKHQLGRVAGHRRPAVPRLGPLRHPQAGAARESIFLSFFLLSLEPSLLKGKKLSTHIFLPLNFSPQKTQIMLFRRPKDYQATQQPLAPAHNAQNVPAQ